MKSLLAAIPLLSALFPATGQQPQDWRMPFRNPAANLVPPEDVYRELRIMQRITAKADPAELSYDENGIETCDDPAWRKAYERLMGLRLDAGYLSSVIRESGLVADRETAFYGSFYVPDPGLVLQLIAHVPGEPVRQLRENAYKRAIAFLQVHLPKVHEGDLEEWSKLKVGPGIKRPPPPGSPMYAFDPIPFAALLDLDDYRDQVQGLWFLRECVRIRPSLADSFLDLTKDALRGLLVSDEPGVQQAADEYLEQIDPQHRAPPAGDASDQDRVAWLDAVLFEVFPPIRPVSSGLVDLYSSEDLDQIVEVGKRELENESLGDPHNGTLSTGNPYRGFRIGRTPPPLDKLGLKVGWVITSINGTPVATGAEIVKIIESTVKSKRSYLVELVNQGTLRAIEFRLR